MPLFPVLDIEDKVQERDKTRLDASKSYVSGGSTFDTLSVKPSASEDFIDVTTALHLDWQYEFAFDIQAGVNDKIDFNENGTLMAVTLTEDVYTPAELAAHIQIKMRTASAVDYVVSVDDDNAFTFVGTLDFALLGESGVNAATSILPAIGFEEDSDEALTVTGEDVETIDKEVTVEYRKEVVSPGDDIVETVTKTLPIVSEIADHLFSTDDKLRRHEANIMSFVPDGRASWKHVHRRAQELIMQWLDTQGFVDNLQLKLEVKRIQDVTEVTDWATMLALQLIFESIRNEKDDVFDAKAKKYGDQIPFYRDRAILRIDLNEDGEIDLNERLQPKYATVVRR